MRFIVILFPTSENKRSDDTEVADTLKYFHAIFDNIGNWFSSSSWDSRSSSLLFVIAFERFFEIRARFWDENLGFLVLLMNSIMIKSCNHKKDHYIKSYIYVNREFIKTLLKIHSIID